MKKAKYKMKQGLSKFRWMPKAPSMPQAAASLALGLFFGLTAIVMVDGVTSTGGAYAIPVPPGTQIADAGEVTTHVYDYSDPNTLSLADRGLYVLIDEAQARGDYSKADALFSKLSNRRLLGYALADRYLSSDYTASKEELSYWFKYFSDQPQATRLAQLAAAKDIRVTLPKAEMPLRGDGYADHLGRSSMPDRWYSALGKWRDGNYAAAYEGFNALSRNDDLSDWQTSAAHFWAYRAAETLGDKQSAKAHLAQAAQYETTFYGLLANAARGVTHLDAEAPEVSDHLRKAPGAIRANLLAQLNRKEDAEGELRQLYSNVGSADRKGIVTLASELNLSNLQLRLQHAPGLTPAEQRFARFPTPQYMMALDPVMDASLVLAVARNESGFRDAVNKSSGARGMMQMLPSTARAVERHVGEELLRTASIDSFDAPVAERLSDPSLSARYGAEYLRLLAKDPAIDNNLIHLLVGYNAGPGTVASWKAAGKNLSDPLLYIESIPYAETRNYVMQVSAHYWIYQMMTDEKPVTLSSLAHGEWPTMPAASAR